MLMFDISAWKIKTNNYQNSGQLIFCLLTIQLND